MGNADRDPLGKYFKGTVRAQGEDLMMRLPHGDPVCLVSLKSSYTPTDGQRVEYIVVGSNDIEENPTEFYGRVIRVLGTKNRDLREMALIA